MSRVTEVQGWTIVHQSRQRWREFEGVFLGNQGDRWIAGRMFNGKSMHDGFSESGEWWQASQFDDPALPEACRWFQAISRYVKYAGDTCVWDGIFQQRAEEAVDQHLADRVSLAGVPDMSAGWVGTGMYDHNPPRGHTYLLPAREAKVELLGDIRRTVRNRCGGWSDEQCKHSELNDIYQAVINATGPVRVEFDHRNTYSLSHEGSYNDADDRWRREARRPHPDRAASA